MRRRKTTLPWPPAEMLTTPKTAASFAAAIKRVYSDHKAHAAQHRAFMQQLYCVTIPDPWDDAVKWIERNQAAKEEWPWPTHRLEDRIWGIAVRLVVLPGLRLARWWLWR